MKQADKNRIAFKSQLYGQFAAVGRALGSARRLEIIDLLAQGERTVEEIATEVGSTISNVSQHLQVLRGAGMVKSRRDGLFVHYELSGEDAATLWQSLRRVSVGLSSELRELIGRFIEGRDTFEQVSHDELLERARAGEIVVVDVRPAREFASGHIPDALSVPLDELENRISDIPRDRKIVAYCRGPYCLLSVEAVERLRELGFDARRLADGFPEWRDAGRPIKTDQ